MKKIILPLVFFVFVGCGDIKKSPDKTTFLSSDGVSQVDFPKGWKDESAPTKKGEIRASQGIESLDFICLTESKLDLEKMTLEEHSSSTREKFTKPDTNVTQTGPVSLTIDGQPAIQYEIAATTKDGVNYTALHTTVETPTHFHQLVAISLRSKYESKKKELEDIIFSFRERQTTAPHTTPPPSK